MSMDIKTALEAFKKLDVKTETGKKTADDMINKGKESPQCGALAFLHRDEDEAIDGYEKALEYFKEDTESLWKIHGIILDEMRHKVILKEIWAKYAIKDENEEKDGQMDGKIAEAKEKEM